MNVSHRWSRAAAGAAVSAALLGSAVGLAAVAQAECPPFDTACTTPGLPEEPNAPEATPDSPVGTPDLPDEPETPAPRFPHEPGYHETPPPGTMAAPPAPSWAPNAEVVWNPMTNSWGVWMGAIWVPVY